MYLILYRGPVEGKGRQRKKGKKRGGEKIPIGRGKDKKLEAEFSNFVVV